MPPAGATAPFTDLYQDDHSVQPVLTPIGNIMRSRQRAFRRRALYAERDGLVSPESCIEDEPEYNIGIAPRHYGMIYSSEAYRTVAELLAEANG